MKLKITTFLLFTIFIQLAFAQELPKTFNVGIQIRPRAEFRNGQGTLIAEGQDPAFFINNRARLKLNYTSERIIIGVAGQSVGVWGQQPQIETTGGFMLNEAWAKILLTDAWNITIGRQALAYDGDRILGTLDWNVSGRFHDLVLLKYEKPKFNAHLGFAYNADSETKTKNYYTGGQPYQHMELGWFSYKISEPLKITALFMNTGMQAGTDTVTSTWKIANMQTLGANIYFTNKAVNLHGLFYAQMGESTTGNDVNAMMASVAATFNATQKLGIFVGADYLSGNDMNIDNKTQNAFNPLYGTNHKYYGFMDYFYVGNHIGSVGLIDLNGGVIYKFTPDFTTRLAAHFFQSPGVITDASNNEMDSGLGTELDLTFAYKIMPGLSFSGGYAVMFATETMEVLKSVNTPKPFQDWAFISLNVDLNIFSTKF